MKLTLSWLKEHLETSADTAEIARRMTALGYNVWLIRFLAILFSGFWAGVAGILFLYYNKFVSPQVVALTTSAEALLMVISGGSGTLLGPIVGAAIVVIMKNVASAYIENESGAKLARPPNSIRLSLLSRQ